MPTTTARRSPLRLQPLLDQQFWFWGQDVRQQPNSLVRFGFSRIALDDRSKGSSRYELNRDGFLIRLWGFGTTVSDADGRSIFVSRFSARPVFRQIRKSGELDVHRGEALPDFHAPREESEVDTADALLLEFCRFVTAYEEWVLGEADGPVHRRKALAQWMHKPCCKATEVAGRWRAMSAQVVA
jgi:hypothetical protein